MFYSPIYRITMQFIHEFTAYIQPYVYGIAVLESHLNL